MAFGMGGPIIRRFQFVVWVIDRSNNADPMLLIGSTYRRVVIRKVLGSTSYTHSPHSVYIQFEPICTGQEGVD